MTPEQLAQYKSQGFTHVHRTPQGQLWGVNLIEGKPVWHRIEFANSGPVNP